MVKLSFRVDHIEQIAIDAHSQAMNLSRSDFCRLAIQEKIARAKNETKQESDTQKILSVLNSLNNNILSLGSQIGDDSKTYKVILGGFRTISRGMVVTNPSSLKELKVIFKDKEIWEKLAEDGFIHG